MITIYKYPVGPDSFNLQLPAGAKILTVQTQNEKPWMWALVNPDAAPETRYFKVRGTGHYCDGIDAANYIGTFQLHGGALVFHVFEDMV